MLASVPPPGVSMHDGHDARVGSTRRVTSTVAAVTGTMANMGWPSTQRSPIARVMDNMPGRLAELEAQAALKGRPGASDTAWLQQVQARPPSQQPGVSDVDDDVLIVGSRCASAATVVHQGTLIGSDFVRE